jgi:hypothetical protein
LGGRSVKEGLSVPSSSGVLAREVESVAVPELWVTLIVMTLFGALVLLAPSLSSPRADDINPALTMNFE